MKKITAAITGVGAYASRIYTRQLRAQQDGRHLRRMDNDKGRHQDPANPEGEGLGTSYMTEKAVNDLLEKTNTDPLDIDMIICATVTPDMFFPSTANLTAAKCEAQERASVSIFSQPAADLSCHLVTWAQYIATRATSSHRGGRRQDVLNNRPIEPGYPAPFRRRCSGSTP